ncbi:MAG TPA: A/G-specific adenine glycosylase, partial [Polyangia bacterium]|nr:A/G-specific adenine glycosylase [Polyangia bacterium]
MKPGAPAGETVARKLLAWFDEHARDLPWRRLPTAYRTLVSELMLQQTVVATVIPYFQRFTARWPTLAALARASEEEVLAMWSGLGYYARARNLHRAARALVADHGGTLPADEQALRALPGIGDYTAAAVAAIAFGQRTFALDGNAARVVARLAGIEEPIDKPATRIRLRAVGETWVPAQRAGAFAEAVMELGATVCTPRAPACDACPLRAECRARALGLTEGIPVRSPRRAKTMVRVAFARVRRDRRVLLVRRPSGLLAGLWSLPTLDQEEEAAAAVVFDGLSVPELGLTAGRATRVGEVRHVFTHRDVTAEVFDVEPAHARSMKPVVGEHLWADEEDLDGLAISSFV